MSAVVDPRLVQPSTTISDQLGTLRNTTALAELGCRVQLIQKLTSAGIPTIREIIARGGGTDVDKGGRHPRSIYTLLESVSRHVEASLYLKSYSELLPFYGGGRGVVHTDAFIRALIYIRHIKTAPELTPDHAYLVASLYHSGEAVLKRCGVCPAVFLAGQSPQVVSTYPSSGDCPLCRELASIAKGRSVVRIPDARAQRNLLNSFAGG